MQVQTLDPDKPVRLRNRACIYCGRRFSDQLVRTKEHVIGRKFVPGVDFSRQWNLIANACSPCNNAKSDLEAEVAAVSMQPIVPGEFAVNDPRLAEHALRKARSTRSSRTGRAVADSTESVTLTSESDSGLFRSINLLCGPQLRADRAYMLATYQVGAFFYFITYDRNSKLGGFWPGGFWPVHMASQNDWGNSLCRSFQSMLSRYAPRVHAVAADEFFKLVIYRSPHPPPHWAWALEWNQNYRLIGFFGDRSAARQSFESLTPIQHEIVESDSDRTIRIRREQALEPEDDLLFSGQGFGSAAG